MGRGRGKGFKVSHSVTVGGLRSNKKSVEDNKIVIDGYPIDADTAMQLERERRERAIKKRSSRQKKRPVNNRRYSKTSSDNEAHSTPPTDAAKVENPFVKSDHLLSIAADVSASMIITDLEELQDVLVQLNECPASVASFAYSSGTRKDGEVTLRSQMVSDRYGIDETAIRSVAGKGTPTDQAIQVQRNHLSSAPANSKNLVVITDGAAYQRKEARLQVEYALAEGTNVLGVCYNKKNDPMLSALMKEQFGAASYIEVQNLSEIPAAVEAFVSSKVNR